MQVVGPSLRSSALRAVAHTAGTAAGALVFVLLVFDSGSTLGRPPPGLVGLVGLAAMFAIVGCGIGTLIALGDVAEAWKRRRPPVTPRPRPAPDRDPGPASALPGGGPDPRGAEDAVRRYATGGGSGLFNPFPPQIEPGLVGFGGRFEHQRGHLDVVGGRWVVRLRDERVFRPVLRRGRHGTRLSLALVEEPATGADAVLARVDAFPGPVAFERGRWRGLPTRVDWVAHVGGHVVRARTHHDPPRAVREVTLLDERGRAWRWRFGGPNGHSGGFPEDLDSVGEAFWVTWMLFLDGIVGTLGVLLPEHLVPDDLVPGAEGDPAARRERFLATAFAVARDRLLLEDHLG